MKPKTKIPKDLQAMLQAAPEMTDARKLRADEVIRPADRFTYRPDDYRGSVRGMLDVSPKSDRSALIRAGRTLVQAARAYGPGFHGVVYRPNFVK